MERPPTQNQLVNDVAALYEALRVPLLRFAAVNNLGKAAEFEDLVQDVFVEFYLNILDGKTINNPTSWLYKAVGSRGIDKIRKNKRELSGSSSLPAPQPDYPREIQDLENAETATQVISLLNSRERTILIMSVDGFSYQEIAEALDTTVKLVSVYKCRAFEKIRTAKLGRGVL
jgi:RNA polymerase sigma-70 factor (ECF subfamily)